ncbi:helix-turn-helix domain-containing protein [Vogesella facilis]|uniref:Helix-turn-helix domain-containing protein n=1 Tax=Vogesella facilis TaxID=1655232 RepID=A0ABV7RJA5_9NEIS
MARSDPKNRTRYWWDTHTPGLSLMCADFTTQKFSPHTHDGFVIAITEAGGSIIKSRGIEGEARTSTLLVFNPAEVHSGGMGWSERWRYRSLYLTTSALDVVAQGLGVASVPYFLRNIFDDADLITGYLRLHRALEDGHDLFQERELLFATFGLLYERHGSGGGRLDDPPQDQVLLQQVVEIMNDLYADNLLLDDISAMVGLTPFQLIGLFKRTLGLTPHTYLTQIRLKRACHYLSLGMPIVHVASATGFYDQSALTKQFKRCYGITPLQFQAAACRPGL